MKETHLNGSKKKLIVYLLFNSTMEPKFTGIPGTEIMYITL